MDWSAADFGVATGLLAAVAGAISFIARRSTHAAYRAAAAVAVLATFLLVWVNGAVGIIGSENNDANFMFAAVIACVVIGAIVTRIRAAGMSRALVFTALVQVAVGVIALAAKLGTEGAAWPIDVIVATVIFTLLWLFSAWLFRRSLQGSMRASRMESKV